MAFDGLICWFDFGEGEERSVNEEKISILICVSLSSFSDLLFAFFSPSWWE